MWCANVFTAIEGVNTFEHIEKGRNANMPDIGADTQAIKDAASKFASQSVQLADLIHNVKSDIDALEGLWKGPAHSQFVDLTNEWNIGARDIQDALDKVAEKVKNAGLGYEDLEYQIQRGFSTGTA